MDFAFPSITLQSSLLAGLRLALNAILLQPRVTWEESSNCSNRLYLVVVGMSPLFTDVGRPSLSCRERHHSLGSVPEPTMSSTIL